MLQLINIFIQHKANTPPGRELVAEAETKEELFEVLRENTRARQHRLLANTACPQVIKDNAKRILSEIDTWEYSLREDNFILIDNTLPECDFYTVEAK